MNRFDTVLVMSCQKSRPGRHAPGADVGVAEANPTRREGIDVRSFDPVIRFRVTTHGAMRMIVRIDEENVGALGGVEQSESQDEDKSRGEGDSSENRSHDFICSL